MYYIEVPGRSESELDEMCVVTVTQNDVVQLEYLLIK